MATGTSTAAVAAPPRRSSAGFARIGGSLIHERDSISGNNRGSTMSLRSSFGGEPSYPSSLAPRTMNLRGTHWTENPLAMEMMRGMYVEHVVPALQPRLTQFHGTRVPVYILLFLAPTEVGRLGTLDTFWQRIVAHPLVWQGLYCRDYSRGMGAAQRNIGCVWQTLNGHAGAERCLCHLGITHPSAFEEICRQITAIPGRSKEELLASYRRWREERAAIRQALLAEQEQLRSRASSVKTGSIAGRLTPEDRAGYMPNANGGTVVGVGAKNGSPASTLGNASSLPSNSGITPKQPWNLRAHSTFALSLSHSRDLVPCSGAQTSREMLRTKPLCPVLPPTSARESRTGPIGRPYGSKGIKVLGVDHH